MYRLGKTPSKLFDRRTTVPVLALAAFLLISFILPLDGDARRRRRRRKARGVKKAVVILPFTGPAGATARAGVIRGLKRKVRMLPLKRFKRTESRLGVDATSAEGMVAVCSKLRCDAIVTGSVSKKRRRFRVVVNVLDGGTGESIGRRAAGRLRGKRKVSRAGKAIGRRLVRLVAKGKYRKHVPKPEPPKPVAVAKKSSSKDIPVYKPRKKSARDDDDDDDDDARIRSRSRSKGKLDGLFEVSAAMGMSFRKYSLRSDTLSINPNLYDGGMYPEFIIRADIYPLVPFMDNPARGVGIGVSYCRHLSISTKPQSTPDAAVDTTSQEFLIDMRYQYVLFDTETSPVLAASFGFGLRDFSLGQNSILTSFNYRFLRVALEGTVPIMTPLVAVHASIDVRPLLNVGQEAVYAFGDRDGGLGFSFRGGLKGKLKFGLIYFANFEYLRFSTGFSGLKQTDTIRSGTPDRRDPTSGTDRFIRIWVGVGYAM